MSCTGRPRDPKLPITNRTAVTFWVVYGTVLAAAAFVPLVAGPDEPSTSHASASLTMTFVVMGLGTVFNALTNRRDPASGLAPPILTALGVSLVPVALIFLATQLPSLQTGLLTTSLTGPQWLAAIGLALALPVVIEAASGSGAGARPASASTSGRSDVARRRWRRRAEHEGKHRDGRKTEQAEDATVHEDEAEGVRARAAPAARRARRHAGVGEGDAGRRSASSSRDGTRRARAARSRRSPSG